MTDDRRLRRGMLVLDPNFVGKPIVWAATSQRTLVAHADGIQITITIRRPGTIPDGWKLIDPEVLARMLTEGDDLWRYSMGVIEEER